MPLLMKNTHSDADNGSINLTVCIYDVRVRNFDRHLHEFPVCKTKLKFDPRNT